MSPGAHAVLVLDGAGWHSGRDLVVPDNISLLTLPPYSPELNPVENVWQFLRANWLAISVLDDYPTIVDPCCTAWNRFAGGIVACTAPSKWVTKIGPRSLKRSRATLRQRPNVAQRVVQGGSRPCFPLAAPERICPGDDRGRSLWRPAVNAASPVRPCPTSSATGTPPPAP